MRLIDAEPLEKRLQARCMELSNTHGGMAGAIEWCLKLAQAQPAIAPPPNDPLTLEELMQIDVGDDTLPVFVCLLDDTWPGGGGAERYAAVNFEKDGKTANAWAVGWDYPAEVQVSEYGKTWLAYRRRPDNLSGRGEEGYICRKKPGIACASGRARW